MALSETPPGPLRNDSATSSALRARSIDADLVDLAREEAVAGAGMSQTDQDFRVRGCVAFAADFSG